MSEARHYGRNKHLLPRTLARALSTLAFLTALSAVLEAIPSVNGRNEQVAQQNMIVPLYVDPNLGDGKETYNYFMTVIL